MIDLFSIAAKNNEGMLQTYEDSIRSLPEETAGKAKDFARWVETSAFISVNLRLYVIVEMLQGSPYRNIHEWADEQSELSARPKDQILRERLGRFYEKRMAFDLAFQDGEHFRYGALNAGGVGLLDYGPFCAVLASDFHQNSSRCACLAGDSLELCFSGAANLNIAAVQQVVVSYSHRHWLVTNKRIGEIDPTPTIEWPRLLISTDCKRYFEVIFIGNIGLDLLQCVRVKATEYQFLWTLAFANFGGSSREADRALVQDFIQLVRAQNDGKIQLEEIK